MSVYWRFKNWLHERSWYKTGTTRQVILVGRYAVKLPITCYGWKNFLLGLRGNTQEASLSRLDRTGRVARVVFSIPSGVVVIQERAYVPRNFKRKFRGSALHQTNHLFAGLPTDMSNRNVGFVGRRLVLIDYGSW